MRIVCISDTHGRHARLEVPPCDLPIHAGDATRRGRLEELRSALAWMSRRFRRMAYNRERGPEIAAHWAAIPEGLDLLLTHGPPRGVGDRAILGVNAGCDDLLARVHLVRPRVHVFGHIHEAAGEYRLPGLPTRFYNVASSRLLGWTRAPVVLELPPSC
ncbi:MAG: metallophosphatase domain-containing protein [Myxococcales bacterium]|nr:metallophosphatase domain-containing protein [Myxococcales bacterium]